MNEDVEILLDIYHFEEMDRKGLFKKEKKDQIEFIDLRDHKNIKIWVDRGDIPSKLKETKEQIDNILHQDKLPTEDENTVPTDAEKEMEEYSDYLKYLINIEEKKKDIERWIREEVAPKMAIIEEITYSSRLSDYRKEIFQSAITPLFHFLDKDKPITPKMEKYLLDLADKNPKRFYQFSNQREDVSNGEFEEIIPKLTKDIAGDCIGWMLFEKDIHGNDVEEGKQ